MGWFRDWWEAERGARSMERNGQLEAELESWIKTAATYQQRNETLAARVRELEQFHTAVFGQLEESRKTVRMLTRLLLAPSRVPLPPPPPPPTPVFDPLSALGNESETDHAIEDAIEQRAGPHETSLRNSLIVLANRRRREKVPVDDVVNEILNGAPMTDDEADLEC